MKKEDVPQDNSNLSKSNVKELCYAVDDKGNYITELSSGWEPKTIALQKSIEDINERIEQARLDVQNNKVSPILYFMELSKMDLAILADYVGMWKWRVKRHFKPSVFSKLNNNIISKYAEAFSISLEELKNFKG